MHTLRIIIFVSKWEFQKCPTFEKKLLLCILKDIYFGPLHSKKIYKVFAIWWGVYVCVYVGRGGGVGFFEKEKKVKSFVLSMSV